MITFKCTQRWKPLSQLWGNRRSVKATSRALVFLDYQGASSKLLRWDSSPQNAKGDSTPQRQKIDSGQDQSRPLISIVIKITITLDALFLSWPGVGAGRIHGGCRVTSRHCCAWVVEHIRTCYINENYFSSDSEKKNVYIKVTPLLVIGFRALCSFFPSNPGFLAVCYSYFHLNGSTFNSNCAAPVKPLIWNVWMLLRQMQDGCSSLAPRRTGVS